MSGAPAGERLEIVYVFHNCFGLKRGERTLLFDVPDQAFMSPAARRTVAELAAGADLALFLSHSHPDHCSRDLAALVRTAARSRVVVADEALSVRPELAELGALALEPGREARIDELDVRAFASTDIGVAFLIRFPGGPAVYHGGDLANWNWDELEPAEQTAAERAFLQAVDELAPSAPAVAFSNADPRMPNWSGAAEFVRRVRPRLFVPMHAFGRPADLRPFLAGLDPPSGTAVFAYSEPGDRYVLDL